jgi:hypothetical protein
MGTNLITQTTKMYFKSLKITHFAITISPILFFLGVYFYKVNDVTGKADIELDHILLYVIPIVVIMNLLLSHFLFNNKLKSTNQLPDLAAKLSNYKVALIIKFALLTGASNLAIIAIILSNNFIFFSFSVVILLFMLLWRPTKGKLIADLELCQQEIDILQDDEAMVTQYVNTYED